MTVRSIPTTYRGARFRSRLEARWGVFFDLVDWTWIYEPLDTGTWIPDFLVSGARGVQGRSPFLVEIGPCASETAFIDKAAKVIAAEIPLDSPAGVTLVLGIAPHVLDGGSAGYLMGPGGGGAAFASWARCPVCGQFSIVYLATGRHRPCGHVDDPRPLDELRLADLWNEAGTQVQWRSR